MTMPAEGTASYPVEEGEPNMATQLTEFDAGFQLCVQNHFANGTGCHEECVECAHYSEGRTTSCHCQDGSIQEAAEELKQHYREERAELSYMHEEHGPHDDCYYCGTATRL